MVIREMRVRVNQHCPMKQSRTEGMTMNWLNALVSWWERQRPFHRSNVDLWHLERQVMPNGPISPNNHAVTGNHRAVETSDDFPSNVDPMWMHERPVTEDLAASTYKF